tara:strand:+ start:138 stop:644 length:507 start_codon:yes stop_codon:yes gene_type:complete
MLTTSWSPVEVEAEEVGVPVHRVRVEVLAVCSQVPPLFRHQRLLLQSERGVAVREGLWILKVLMDRILRFRRLSPLEVVGVVRVATGSPTLTEKQVVVVAVKVHKDRRRQLMVQEYLVREIEVVLMVCRRMGMYPMKMLLEVEVVLAQLAAAVWIAQSVDLDLRVMVG